MRAPAVVLALLALTALVAGADDLSDSLRAIETARRTGDVAAAAALAAGLVAKSPESLEAHIAYQDLELALGHEKALTDKYRAAAKAEGATAAAHFLLGRLLSGAPAVGEFRAALKGDPANFHAMCALAVELTNSKSHAEARTLLDEAAKLRPNSAVPVNLMGRVEEARGKTADAENFYRSALELDPDLTEARVNLGSLLLASGRRDDAMAAFKEAASRAPRDPLPHLATGMALRAVGDEKGALEAFKRANTADGADVVTHNLVASAYVAADELGLADESIQRALKLAPTSVTSLVAMAHVKVKRDLYEEAVKFATAAVAEDDSSAAAHFILAVAWDRMFQSKKADPEFRRAAKLGEDNPDIARGCGAFAASQNDWARAVSEFTRAAKLSGNSPDSLMELASAYTGAGKPKSAASTYEQVVAADPKQVEAWKQLGIVAFRDLKEPKRSLKAFREYVANGGKDPEVKLWIKELEANL